LIQHEVSARRLQVTLQMATEGLLTGLDWQDVLEQFADAAGAGGACLVRDRKGRDVGVLPTPSVSEVVACYLKGACPPNPRRAPREENGFVTDFDEFQPDEIRRSPFYQEFLVPVGFGWHASAFLAELRSGDKLLLSLKREKTRGHYDGSDIAILNAILPSVRALASFSEMILNAETRAAEGWLESSNDGVLHLDRSGRLLNKGGPRARSAEFGLSIIGDRLAAMPHDQDRLARAIRNVLDHEAPTPAQLILSSSGADERLLLTLVPVRGAARDVFGATAALVGVRAWRRPRQASERLVAALVETFGLSNSEARTAALIGSGLSPRESAALLGISLGTGRNYLKTAFQKIGIARQNELAVIVAQLGG
jgi:DNA-binding CsgD family transcriptional regulator